MEQYSSAELGKTPVVQSLDTNSSNSSNEGAPLLGDQSYDEKNYHHSVLDPIACSDWLRVARFPHEPPGVARRWCKIDNDGSARSPCNSVPDTGKTLVMATVG